MFDYNGAWIVVWVSWGIVVMLFLGLWTYGIKVVGSTTVRC